MATPTPLLILVIALPRDNDKIIHFLYLLKKKRNNDSSIHEFKLFLDKKSTKNGQIYLQI